MSGDALCVGVCMIDWDSGVCLGCGRTADEINGVPVPTARDGGGTRVPPGAADPGTATLPGGAPLPPCVAAQLGEGSD
ncbi:DUF1289 domain-containing protein [Thauera sp.]|jgi:hypothetical protein|uniref:DUF1289 domain-containing protein n=1 Tax=Thauera sp. TaxID=1905334 RepID=UPI00263083B5|nr:DUF1289 domain-containing protein [Thauera sp.]MCK6407948.1 DUF1289 domain-containing protein [Thauera sp.]